MGDFKGHKLPSYQVTPYMCRSIIPLIWGWPLLRVLEWSQPPLICLILLVICRMCSWSIIFQAKHSGHCCCLYKKKHMNWRYCCFVFRRVTVTNNMQSRLHHFSSEELKPLSFRCQRRIITLKRSGWRRENGTCSFSLALWKTQDWGEKNPRLPKDSPRRNTNQQLRHQQARDRFNIVLMIVNFKLLTPPSFRRDFWAQNSKGQRFFPPHRCGNFMHPDCTLTAAFSRCQA